MSFEQQIQKESERFHTLCDRLFDTQWSEAALPEAQAQLTAYENQARLTQNNINAFNAAADKEYERLVNIKGHGVKHVWYKIRGKLEQHLDEQEMTWLRDFEKCKEEEQRLLLLKEKINTAQTYLQQCQDTYEETTTQRAIPSSTTNNETVAIANGDTNLSRIICFKGKEEYTPSDSRFNTSE
ncbi:unnamed protein product [Rotaria sordida]|uniref:Uncharacterized protein n=1 Tax=Rotaria sordida TaxID=392033 RepID=A0A819FAL5_9BILA|nr:unnamed protein product [Rotaria sordida]